MVASNASLRVVSAAVVALLTFTLYDASLFSYHPVCMSLAYVLFMTEAVRTAISFRGKLGGEERVRSISRHMYVNVAAVLLAIAGFVAIYKNKIRLGKQHFQSYHARIGLFVFVSTLAVAAGGFLSFKKMGLINFFAEKLHPTIKRGHRAAGVVTYFFAVLVVELGLLTGAVTKHGMAFRLALQVGTAVVAAIVAFRAFFDFGSSRAQGYTADLQVA